MLDLINGQLSDPFRIVLLIALFSTMLRTRAATGIYLPLAAGAFFVAAILPMTMSKGGDFMPAMLAGLIANVTILAIILGVWTIYQNAKRK